MAVIFLEDRDRPVSGLGEKIKIGTWATSSKGIYGYRDFVIMDQEGNYLVRAESVWFSMTQRR